MVRPIDQFIVDGFRDDPDSMAVVEQMLQRYFDKYMATEMDRVRSEVYQQQAQHLRESQGVLSSLATGSNPAIFDDPLTREIVTGTNMDLFKSPEDMVLFCKRQLRMDPGMCQDMTILTEAWRHSAIIRIGQPMYDELSDRIGEDLARAYMDYRLSELILNKMVKEQAPTSTVDYVVRKACEGSLFGIAQSLNKTPMQMRIEEEAEQMLSPGKGAKVTARVLSVALDAPMTGALTCWGSLIGVGALEVGMEMAQPVLISQVQGEKRQSTVEEILSKAMFLSDEDEFAKMRSQKLDYISETNVVNTLQPKMHNSGDLFSHDDYAQNQSSSPAKDFGREEDQESIFLQSPYASNSKSSDGNGSVFSLGVNPSMRNSERSEENKSSSKSSFQTASSSNASSFSKDNEGYGSASSSNIAKSSSSKGKSNSSPAASSSSKNTSTSSSSSSESSSISSSSSEIAQNNTPVSSETKPLSSNTSSNKPISSAPQKTNICFSSDERERDKSQKSNANKKPTTTAQSPDADGSNGQNVNQDKPPQKQTNQAASPKEFTSTNVSKENASQNTFTSAPVDEDREMASQWAPLIGQFGLKDIAGVGANLGLVLATLPDMLFGMFSKKEPSEEFSWSKNLIPLASLLLGFKFQNPLLKMLLIGFGGVGLIKNGMDHLTSKDAQNQSLNSPYQRQVRFVPYAEQPLNPRIENLEINNNILVMDIDKVPYSITLPEPVAMAYRSNSLPLSTLANAVLQKYDEAVSAQLENDQTRGIHRYNPQMDLQSSQHESVALK